jgi:hypothetical protein
MSEPRTQWVGWVWQRGRWLRVCEGETLGDCSRRLGEKARRLGIRDKHAIMTTGAVPSIAPLESHRIAQDAFEGAEPARGVRRE